MRLVPTDDWLALGAQLKCLKSSNSAITMDQELTLIVTPCRLMQGVGRCRIYRESMIYKKQEETAFHGNDYDAIVDVGNDGN